MNQAFGLNAGTQCDSFNVHSAESERRGSTKLKPEDTAKNLDYLPYTSVFKYFKPESTISVTTLAPRPRRCAI
jgi:hypothetical protein